MKKVIFAWAALAGLCAFATTGADEIITRFRCEPVNSADTGYRIDIVSGGFIGQLRAEVYSLSFTGASHTATYFLKEQSEIDGAYFTDIGTNGNQFNLTLDYSGSTVVRPFGLKVPGYLKSSIDGKIVTENLYCLR